MGHAVIILTLVAGAIFAALAATAGMVGATQLTVRRTHGYMHLIFYAIVLVVALGSLLSGRDLNSDALMLSESAAPVRQPLMILAQPLVSMLMLAVAGERIITHWLKREKATHPSYALLVSFVLFWTGTVAAPALLGAHPGMAHDYFYSLIIGIAATLTTGIERDLAIKSIRNALLLFMVAGLLLIPLKPALVLDTSYTQGLIPGLPRLAGLAPHAVSLGALAQICLLCLMACPCRRVWLNRLAWGLGLAVLFLSQSKVAWICFAVCSICIVAVRGGGAFWRRFSNPFRPEFGVLVISLFMVVVLAVALVLMFGHVEARWDSFFSSGEGAQLASLTGRDKIWAVAYDVWQRDPIFGYGPSLFDEGFRASIGMPYATHAHNEFMDVLSRSGTVGAVCLVIYALVLFGLSLRYARASGGLTLALFAVLVLRSVSEVPLSLFGYGPELIAPMLLIMTLTAAGSEARIQKSEMSDARAHATHSYARGSLAPTRFNP